MAFSFPYTLTAGTPENVNNVQSDLSAIKDELNGVTTTSDVPHFSNSSTQTFTGRVTAAGVDSTTQDPAVVLRGDVDGAKWLTKTGNNKLILANENSDATTLGTGDTTYLGRTYKPKAAFGQDGSLTLAGLLSIGAGNSNVLKLASAADRKATFGATTLSFPNSAFSTVKTVAHGLGATPVVVFVSFGSGATGVTHNINSVDGTNFTVAGYSSIGAINGSVSFYWLAIG